MHYVGSLFLRYLSHLAWSRHGLLTRLAWAYCSRGIHHAWHGLVTVFSHALHGLIVLTVFITPGVVASRSSHTPCMGSSFVSWGLVVAAPVTGKEVGLWREIIFDFDLSHFNTTGFVRSSSPYRPGGVSIFSDRRRSIHTKERSKQDRNQGSQRMTQNRKTRKRSNSTKGKPIASVLPPIRRVGRDIVYGSKARKSSSGESGSLTSVQSGVLWFPSNQISAEWPRPVARRKWRSGFVFSGAVMNSKD